MHDYNEDGGIEAFDGGMEEDLIVWCCDDENDDPAGKQSYFAPAPLSLRESCPSIFALSFTHYMGVRIFPAGIFIKIAFVLITFIQV